MTNGWLQLAQEALKDPGLLKEIYGDLAQPGVRQVGKALETVLGLGNTILWPIALVNERSRIYLKKNLESYRERLESIPEEKIIPIAPEIGVPIAEKLAYVSDDKLSELYITLLAKASSSDTVSTAHPSFVNVINNLSPDEARLLQYFLHYTYELPFMEARWVSPDTGAFASGGDLLLAPDYLAPLKFPTNAQAYISNLAGLGLLGIHHGLRDTREGVYDAIETHWKTKISKLNLNFPNEQLLFKAGVIDATAFGRLFIDTCHKR